MSDVLIIGASSAIAQAAAQKYLIEPDLDSVEAALEQSLAAFRQPAGDVNNLRDRLIDLMWNDVGVLRDADGLNRARQGLSQLKSELSETGVAGDSRIFNISWHDWLNLNSLLEMSEVIAAAALSRENSRGAHYREDFTDPGSLEDSYFTVANRQQGDIQVQRKAVEFSIVRPGESLLDND